MKWEAGALSGSRDSWFCSHLSVIQASHFMSTSKPQLLRVYESCVFQKSGMCIFSIQQLWKVSRVLPSVCTHVKCTQLDESCKICWGEGYVRVTFCKQHLTKQNEKTTYIKYFVALQGVCADQCKVTGHHRYQTVELNEGVLGELKKLFEAKAEHVHQTLALHSYTSVLSRLQVESYVYRLLNSSSLLRSVALQQQEQGGWTLPVLFRVPSTLFTWSFAVLWWELYTRVFLLWS